MAGTTKQYGILSREPVISMALSVRHLPKRVPSEERVSQFSSALNAWKRRGSVVASTSACHAAGRGSIPGPGMFHY